jgi:formylglycine-generating enzyme required for sulfatase activity
MKIKLLSGVALLFAFAFLSAQSSDKKNRKNVIKAINEHYVFIPADSIIQHDYIIFKTEVSNLNYREFLYDLKKNGDLDKYKIAQIDSALWSTKNWNNSAYENYYHMHFAYNHYPVVNITREGAELYCEWLTEKVNSLLNGSSKIIFRLPTHAEWLKAAKGKLELASYAWGGYRLQNAEGSYMCNCIAFGGECISRDSTGNYKVEKVSYDHIGVTGDYADITAPVKSYWPNGYGLYNVNGNVAEMIADKRIVAGGSWNDPGYDVRNESFKNYTGAARNVGFRVVATIVPSEHDWLKIPKVK